MAPRFNPMTLKELLEKSAPDIRWAWEPFIPLGFFTLFTSYMKVGKTTFIYALIAAILNGNKFLGFPTHKCKILLLAVEEGETLVRNRLLRFGINPDDPNLFIHVWTLPYAEIKLVREYVKEHSIDLVLIDTISKLWGPMVEDENDNAQIQRAIEPLLAMVREEHIGLLAIHHDGKAGGEGGRQVRGASSLLALADQCLMLSRVGKVGNPERKLQALGRFDNTPQNIQIIYLADEERFDLTFHDDDYHGEDGAERAVRELLKDGVAKSLEELHKTGKLSRRRLERLLQPPPPWLSVLGTGKKGDPYKYKLIE